jgi:ferredoxin-NADP reductase
MMEFHSFRFTPPTGDRLPFDYLAVRQRQRGAIVSKITIKREDHGLVSRWLHDELKVGDEIDVEAPNGTFIFSAREADSVVLIAGGVGITPMMSTTRYLTETRWPGRIYLVLGFQAPRDFIFRDEITALASSNTNLSVTVAMSRPGDESRSGTLAMSMGGCLPRQCPILVT